MIRSKPRVVRGDRRRIAAGSSRSGKGKQHAPGVLTSCSTFTRSTRREKTVPRRRLHRGLQTQHDRRAGNITPNGSGNLGSTKQDGQRHPITDKTRSSDRGARHPRLSRRKRVACNKGAQNSLLPADPRFVALSWRRRDAAHLVNDLRHGRRESPVSRSTESSFAVGQASATWNGVDPVPRRGVDIEGERPRCGGHRDLLQEERRPAPGPGPASGSRSRDT